MRSSKVWSKIENALVYLALVAAVFAALFPIAWTLSTSFKTTGEYYTFPPVWIPNKPTLENYIYIYRTGGLGYLVNSLLIAGVNVLLVLAVSIPAAYAIARLQVGGQNFAFWILSQRMFPPVAAVIPLFLLFSKVLRSIDPHLELIDRHLSLILTYSIFNVAFAVWLLIGFFEEFPPEIEDAALVDGCSRRRALVEIYIPLLAPGIIVAALFCFIFSWNEFLFAMIFTREAAKTVTVKLAEFQAPTKILWGEMSALATISIIPVIAFAVFLQRYLVRGLALGGVKG